MCRSCRQLACAERCRISILLSRGDSIREIARCLGRSPATISREIARNRGEGGGRKMTPEKWQQAEACLREGWSPEQVSGRFRLEGEEMASRSTPSWSSWPAGPRRPWPRPCCGA